jgi:membrane protein YdbS with pleckstrin-like domain
VDVTPEDDAPHRPDPRARTLWSVVGGLAGAVVGGTLGLISVVAGAWPVALVIVPAAIVAGVALGRAAWRRRTWALGPLALELHRGVVVERATSIPYERIQQIDVERGPIERVMGLSQLVVRTAAATTDASLYGLAPDVADRLRDRLLDLAGIDDLV